MITMHHLIVGKPIIKYLETIFVIEMIDKCTSITFTEP